MKKTALILCGILLFYGANAMNPEKQEAVLQLKIPAMKFVVNTVPSVEILQYPSEEKVVLDGGIIARQINLQCKTYNGIKTEGPLKISHDMSKEEMFDALFTAFGKSVEIDWFEGFLVKTLPEK